MRVLVVSHDLVQRRMAGPGIRYLHLSRVLANAGHDVTLAVPAPSDLESEAFPITPFDGHVLRHLGGTSDVVIAQGWVYERHDHLRTGPAHTVVDLYDPWVLENLVLEAASPPEQQLANHRAGLGVLNRQLRDGDFFICAGERQRDYWLGALTAMGRVNPETVGADPTLRSLIACVPFGIPDEPPTQARHAIRGALPGIGADDLVVLWGGGLYGWLDPLTAVRGVAEAAERIPTVRLVLHAGRHPNPDVPEMEVVDQTRREADRLGVLGSHVILNETWVPYEERADWLLDADIGISTHHDHVETRLSFRTRILDYIWTGLPVVCTAGDTLADTIDALGLGRAVPAGDTGAVADAIVALADPDVRAGCRRAAAAAAKEMTWSRVAIPLVRFCDAPRPAADLAGMGRENRPAVPGAGEAAEPGTLRERPTRPTAAALRRMASRTRAAVRRARRALVD